MSLLIIKDLAISYGGIKAVKGISFTVEAGEIVTLIGANGAGKSSTLKALSGLITYSGQINFNGQSLRQVASHNIVRLGLTQVPEGRGIFGNLTVEENLKIAASTRRDKYNFDQVFKFFPRLKERLNQLGGTLSGGEQQMLAIGRALMSNSKMLLLDEPSMGLSPILVEEIFVLIKQINEAGTTILLVEQNAFRALQIAHRGYVLETGTIKLSGTGEELSRNPQVKAAYLGG